MARTWRVHHPHDAPGVGSVVDVDPEEAHYVVRVLRLREGEPLALFDGRGREWVGRLVQCGPGGVRVEVERECVDPVETALPVTLFQGLSRPERMEWVIQKVSELGVREIHPVAAHRAVPALDPERAEQKRGRWQTIAQEASRQSGRSTVTDVRPVLSFDEIVEESENVDISLLFTTEALSPLEALAQEQIERPRRMLLLVGPEGGFSPEEEQTAMKQGFLPVGLGPRVLRAETAAILAVGLVQYRFGDLGGSPADLTPTDP